MTIERADRRIQICTFYSYKGGVGRSMALANVATLLARSGKRVLVVDWDLEAPGLERYFESASPGISQEVSLKSGIVDLATAVSYGGELDWRECVVSIFIPGAPFPLDLISAGRRSTDYAARLHQLDWDSLFSTNDFGRHLEAARNEWLQTYDHVLIDSRTGITDIGGICTIYLPDVLIAFFTANHQSVEGISEIVIRSRRARSTLPVDRGALIAVPVPARDESRTEYEQSAEWRTIYERILGSCYEDFLPRDVSSSTALDVLRIPNVPYWSFGERLPVLEESASDPSAISYYYSILARLLATDLSWLDSVPRSPADEGDIKQPAVRPSKGDAVGGNISTVWLYGSGRGAQWAQSAYLARVGDIAPSILLDRDAELGELFAFCSGTEAYLSLHGSAWAGKTALLSWFVLNPPQGVDIVSFFATSRLAGQANSQAFTEAVSEQLSSLLGEDTLPSQASDAHRRSLIRRATERATRAGRRLVLVVDGLDEDLGGQSVPLMPSIASLLPRPYSDGLKVITSSRPFPPVPDDVPNDHPLRSCRTMELSPSPAVRMLSQAARHEVRNLLRANAAEQGVIGMIAASRGGVTTSDLLELVGIPPFQLRELLTGGFGRSFSLDSHSRIFFAQATLADEAELALGERLLSTYRDRVHAWADRYRAAGWPTDTPEYLATPYARLLQATGDAQRLLACAIDEMRHDFLHRATGGDRAASSEIQWAQDLVLRDANPDLFALLLLSQSRDRIGRRDAGAQDLRVRAIAQIVLALSSVGDIGITQKFGTEVPKRFLANPSMCRSTETAAEVVRVLLLTGDFDGAEALARTITDPRAQAQALAALVQGLATAGEVDRAEALARTITDPRAQAQALAALARVLTEADRGDEAARLIDRAETLAHTITNPRAQAQALAALARVLTEADRGDEAARLIDRAETLAHTITDPRAQAQAYLASATALTGKITEASRFVALALATGQWSIALNVLVHLEPSTARAIAERL